MPELPKPFQRFERQNAAVVNAYKALGNVVALAAPTVGFPTTVAAFTWVEELLAGSRKGTSR